MIIVVTTDQTVIDASHKADAAPWGGISDVPRSPPGTPPLTQDQATQQVETILSNAGPTDDICFSGHGNDTEIGGEGGPDDPWGWTADDIARMLSTLIQNKNWRGRVLFHVCCESVANFSARIAIALGKLGRHKITCYGYNRALPANEGIPLPKNLDKNVSLQPTIS